MDISQSVKITYNYSDYAGVDVGADAFAQFFQYQLGVSSSDIVQTGFDTHDSALDDPSLAYLIELTCSYTLPFSTPGKYTYSKTFKLGVRNEGLDGVKRTIKLLRDQWIADSTQKALQTLDGELTAGAAGTFTPANGLSLIDYAHATIASIYQRFPTVDNPN